MNDMNLTRHSRPDLETLESRLALTSYINNGDLIIEGTNARDVVEVRQVTWWGMQFYTVTENGVLTNSFEARQVWGGDIGFWGYGGNDYVNNWAGGLNLWAWGGEGDDVLIGDAGADHLFGEGGNDILYGYGGNDDLRGGWGADSLYGGDGNDWMDGGAGDGFYDYLEGGRGADGYCISYWLERDTQGGYNTYEGDWTYFV
jgi:Ca2+-binding RTX toxin-like protein